MAKYRKSQGWAERKVNTACNKFINTYPIKPWTHYAAQTLLAEHRRAVRVVKQEIVAAERLRDTALRFDNMVAKAVYTDTIVALNKVLAALQRGRE